MLDFIVCDLECLLPSPQKSHLPNLVFKFDLQSHHAELWQCGTPHFITVTGLDYMAMQSAAQILSSTFFLSSSFAVMWFNVNP